MDGQSGELSKISGEIENRKEMTMRRARIRIGILTGVLSVALMGYGLFFNKIGMVIPEEIYYGLMVYVLCLLWYLYRQIRKQDGS